jgi:5-methyltetrahydrofolate--homocysteine methyltransferase
MSEQLFEAMTDAVIAGDGARAVELAEEALANGVAPLDAIDQGLVPGLTHVGDMFSAGEMYLPDMMLAAKAMKRAMTVLEPEMLRRATTRNVLGRVVLGTAGGDIHEIGKNLVAMMLTAVGFEVHDLGVDVPVQRFVEAAREHNADIVGVSALLTTTMTGQRTVIEALDAAGMRPGVKVLVGGAPVTPEWANAIGADGYGEDAIGAVDVAKRLVAAPETAPAGA